MPKRITEHERIVTYAMSASADQLQDAIGTLTAIQASRFPREKKKRKPRTLKPVADNLELPGMPPLDESLAQPMASD